MDGGEGTAFMTASSGWLCILESLGYWRVFRVGNVIEASRARCNTATAPRQGQGKPAEHVESNIDSGLP